MLVQRSLFPTGYQDLDQCVVLAEVGDKLFKLPTWRGTINRMSLDYQCLCALRSVKSCNIITLLNQASDHDRDAVRVSRAFLRNCKTWRSH